MIYKKFINKQKIVFSMVLPIYIVLASVVSTSAFADTNSNCQPIYGGGTICTQSTDISIDKKILNPQTGALVDTLTANDYKFTPGQIVSFQITIKNTSGNTLSNITLKDIFPNKYLNFYSGPGKFDYNSKTIVVIINTLNKNETQEYTIRATVANQNELPNNQTTCLINQAQVTEGTQTSQANTQFCIQPISTEQSIPINQNSTKGGLPVYNSRNTKRTPSTGPEDLAVFGLLPTGALGWFLRKKTKLN